jgi:hypothetical protein
MYFTFQEENSQEFRPISGPIIGAGEELDVEDLYIKYKVSLSHLVADYRDKKTRLTIIRWGLGTAALPCDGLFILTYSVRFVSTIFPHMSV